MIVIVQWRLVNLICSNENVNVQNVYVFYYSSKEGNNNLIGDIKFEGNKFTIDYKEEGEFNILWLIL